MAGMMNKNRMGRLPPDGSFHLSPLGITMAVNPPSVQLIERQTQANPHAQRTDNDTPAAGIGRAAFVGTSRGGILTMLLAVARPTAIAGCVLNDIGPVIESGGLMRIKSYVGKLPQPASFQDAADILQRLFGSHFPKWGDADWLGFARRTFKAADGRLVADYDVKLATTLAGITSERPLPPLWK